MIVRDGLQLVLPEDFSSYSLFKLPTFASWVADLEYAGDFFILDKRRTTAIMIEHFKLPTTMSWDAAVEYYKKNLLLDHRLESSIETIHASGGKAHILSMVDNKNNQTNNTMLMQSKDSGEGFVLQVRGAPDTARAIFSSASLRNRKISARRVASGLDFYCSDVRWSWESDFNDGIVVRNTEANKNMIAVVASTVFIDKFRNEHSDLFHKKALRMTSLLDQKASEINGWLIAESAAIFSLEKAFGGNRSIYLSFSDKLRLTPDGRLDEPAIEALLSTYLSFEEPGK